MMIKFSALAAVLLAMPVAGEAATVTVFSEDFASEVAGKGLPVQQVNFTGLDQFDIIDGSVDLFTNGGFGLPCGSGGCLDLDGTSSSAARIESSSDLTFAAGLAYEITLGISGKNRNGSETLTFGVLGGASSVVSMPSGDNSARIETLAFTGTGISAPIFIDHDGGDNFGILLDSVTVAETTAPVPLPASLPLLLAALGGAALLGRRRGRV